MRKNKKINGLTIEADTPDEAMQEVTARLGPNARIESARRTTRGGIGGFFATERFEIQARAPRVDEIVEATSRKDADVLDEVLATVRSSELASAPIPASAVPVPEPDFATALRSALFGGESADEDDEILQAVRVGPRTRVAELPAGAAASGGSGSTMVVERTVAAATPAPSVAVDDSHLIAAGAPAWRIGEIPSTRRGMGVPAWGVQSLVRLGIPSGIVEKTAGLDPRDDLGWINAIADAVAPLCGGEVTDGDALIGPAAGTIADAADIPFVNTGTAIPAGGMAAAVARDDEASIAWLRRVLDGRRLHLAIGESPWMHLLVADPAVVSYGSDRAVVDALYVARTLGSKLGFGVASDGSIVRVTPIDVALSVRRLVGRR